MANNVLYDFGDSRVKITFSFPIGTTWADWDIIYIKLYDKRTKTLLQTSAYPSGAEGSDSDLVVPDTQVGICYMEIGSEHLVDVAGSLIWTIEGQDADSDFSDMIYNPTDRFEKLTVEGL